MPLPLSLDHNTFPKLADFISLPFFSRNNHYHECDVFVLTHVFIFLIHNFTSISDKYFRYAGFQFYNFCIVSLSMIFAIIYLFF